MADPSEIDAAIVAKLGTSVQLATLFPDGIYFDVAPPDARQFVIVSLVIGQDEDIFGEADAGIQTRLYLVKVVDKTQSGTNVRTGAALIHELLQKTTLEIEGYDHMVTHRVEPVRYTEVDEDTDERWQHRGGRYEVMCSAGESAYRQGAFDVGAFSGG